MSTQSLVARVSAIAERATAHNYGPTVWQAAEWRKGEVWLRMSSWPRAQEAKKALEAAGYIATEREDSPCSLMVREATA